MTRVQPENQELAKAVREFCRKEFLHSERGQRVLVISETANGYEVHTRMGPAEVRKGVHLSLVQGLLRESESTARAIIHFNLKGVKECAFVCLLEDETSLYRLRPQEPPRPWRWLPVTTRMRERWDEVWGALDRGRKEPSAPATTENRQETNPLG